MIPTWEFIDRLKKNELELNLSNIEHKNFIAFMYNYYLQDLEIYKKIYEYYKGNTDSINNYKMISKRSNLKINTNFFKKFVKEEVSYTVGNPITYENKNEKVNALDELNKTLCDWNKNHDSDLMKYLIIFTKVFEIYTYSSDGFKSIISTPLTGYSYQDEHENVLFHIETRIEHLDVDKIFIDVYTKKCVYHLDESFNQIKPPTIHKFGEVPVAVGKLSEELYNDSLYKDLKGLQDAYETNLSDLANEISDFRNAYLILKNCTFGDVQIIKDEDGNETMIDPLEDAKSKGILETGKDGDIKWLIKELNDSFVQNTLDRYLDSMYQITSHINHNEKMQSNLSGIALRARLNSLENKCSLQIQAHCNIITKRLKFWTLYHNYTHGKNFDYKDIKIIYTPNIPQDDLATAQMLNQLPSGIISKKTAASRFGFVVDLDAERHQIRKEQEEEFEIEEKQLGDMYGNGQEDE